MKISVGTDVYLLWNPVKKTILSMTIMDWAQINEDDSVVIPYFSIK